MVGPWGENIWEWLVLGVCDRTVVWFFLSLQKQHQQRAPLDLVDSSLVSGVMVRVRVRVRVMVMVRMRVMVRVRVR